MKRLFGLFLLVYAPLVFGQESYSIDTFFMGSAFSFTAIAETPAAAKESVDHGMEEVVRIEQKISSWRSDSETSRINQNAGVEPQKVSWELFQLIARSKKISRLSDGNFDISFASIGSVWDFKSEYTAIPSDSAIAASVALIDYHNIVLNENDTTVFLTKKGMKIGFGAIGKGYAAERAKAIMLQYGASSGVVNAGGDLIAWGQKSEENLWNIGIQDPNDKHNVLMSVPVSNTAVVTSGNYERYVTIDGVDYCHIINPKTGWPVRNLKSVTIICPNAELADGLATTVFVLGREKGMEMVNQLLDVEAIIIDENNDIFFSQNIASNYATHN